MSHPIQNLAAVATLALAVVACAPVDNPEPDQYDATLANLDTSRACFFTREVNGYSNAPESSAGRERIYIDTGVNEQWLLETLGTCPELDFSQQVALDTRSATSVCTGNLENLLVPSVTPGEVDRCAVRVLGRVIEE